MSLKPEKSFVISRRECPDDDGYLVTTVPAIKVGNVFVYKYQGTYFIMHRNGMAIFWIEKKVKKQQVINWAKRDFYQKTGIENIPVNERVTKEYAEGFLEEFEYSVFWGFNTKRRLDHYKWLYYNDRW